MSDGYRLLLFFLTLLGIGSFIALIVVSVWIWRLGKYSPEEKKPLSKYH